MTTQVVSHATVEALGDLLLESASVQPALTAHEQRRKQSYKSNALINKTMKQSQEERRKIALTEQAKVSGCRSFQQGMKDSDLMYTKADIVYFKLCYCDDNLETISVHKPCTEAGPFRQW